MSFANFPVETVYTILSEAVLEGDKPIAQINRLPQNGEARDSKSLHLIDYEKMILLTICLFRSCSRSSFTVKQRPF